MTTKIKTTLLGLSFAAAVAALPVMAYAATTANSELTQEITAGVISTDITDSSGSSVANPSFTLASKTVSNQQQVATGTLGTNGQRLSVDNPGGANGGWTLAWNATTPGDPWDSGSHTYKYNGTSSTGQLTVDPSVGTLASTIGSNTGINLAGSSSFSSTTPVSLLTASASSDDIWNGYVTGIGLSQSIPASQPAGSYAIDMTQTVTAN